MEKQLKLVLTDTARRDLDDIFDYIALDDPHAAESFIRRIYEKCLTLTASPFIGAPRGELREGLRAQFLGRYVIYYMAGEDELQIMRVLNGARDREAIFREE
ncbi:type II toxin-antitoxin system RelE/ParE family toxin [Novosphingobium beihaiensis]|uniref:type II toxin-antitoxin system RelE/ParE family toxin n=1 Tax=Novosphingobium beihaiensis TaxID=2930389 RepID=UPI0038995F58